MQEILQIFSYNKSLSEKYAFLPTPLQARLSHNKPIRCPFHKKRTPENYKSNE